MAPQPESAEEACRRAEALFLAGDVRAAHLMAQRAQTLSPALPGVASALAAYAVHAAAANRGRCPDWRAVLGLGRAQEPLDAGLSEHDVIRRQFRRMSLLVHPDKNPSAAAEGAFKLLRQACDALSATASRHRPGNATAAAGHSHHRSSYATASGMRGTYAEAATKYAPSPATTQKPTTATAGNHPPSHDTAAKHTADHWRNTPAYASAAGLDDDYDYDYHDDDYYDYSRHYYNYHGQYDAAETHTRAAGYKDDDDAAETRNPATGNKDGGSCGPREDTRIICLSCDCEGGLAKPVGVPVPGSECSWCGQTMTRVSGAAMD